MSFLKWVEAIANFSWGFFWIISALAACIVVATMLATFLRKQSESSIDDDDDYTPPRKQKELSIIKMRGMNTEKSISLERYRQIIDAAFDAPKAKHVAILLDCPGGRPNLAEEVATYLHHKATETKIPLSVFVENVAASGGYWLACVADKIYVGKTSIVGSIGVIMGFLNFAKFLESLGIKMEKYTAGEFKSPIHPFSETSQESAEYTKKRLAELHGIFIEHVRKHRGDKLKEAPATIFEADVFTGQKAIEVGLADEIGNFWSDREKLFPNMGFTIYEKKPKKSLFKRLMGTEAESLLTSLFKPHY